MPAEVTVGPLVLSINRGTTFMVTDERGEVDARSEQGIFADDTRFVSHLRLTIQGKPWVLLTSAVVHHYTVQLQLANPALVTIDSDFADIFEVRAHHIPARSGITTAWDSERSELSIENRNQNFEGRVVY